MALIDYKSYDNVTFNRVFTVAVFKTCTPLLYTYHLGGPQVDEQVVIQRVGVTQGVVSVRQTQPGLQN